MERWPLSESDFDRVLNQITDDYRKMIGTDAYEWLARVAVQQYLVLDGDANR